MGQERRRPGKVQAGKARHGGGRGGAAAARQGRRGNTWAGEARRPRGKSEASGVWGSSRARRRRAYRLGPWGCFSGNCG